MTTLSTPEHAAPIGVLITNLGTPAAPTPAALRRYLAEFLWDRRVVDLPRPLWWLILHGIILLKRPRRSAHAYAKVWSEEGAPLLVISHRQQRKLQQKLDALAAGKYKVALGMRYGTPSIAAALEELSVAGVTELVVLPLYPQNSCSTTASTFDAVSEIVRRGRFVPQLRFIADYHDHPRYITALADSIREAWQQQPRGEKLLFSFHGTPERFRFEGDVYYSHCMKTAELTAGQLGLREHEWLVTFQSRFGREEWLKPYTDETLKRLTQEGVKHLDILCPGFSADCLETLEEIAVENRASFIAAGGSELRYIPALNERDDHIAMMAELITGR
ncbi:MAG TPA: ferrochelatase [Gammaproteobacteria bacterium]